MIHERFRQMEIRAVDAGMEVRHRTEGDSATIVGYAARFNRLSQNLGGFVEEVAPGAFEDTLAQKVDSKRNDIRALLNHDPNFVLGRTSRGTLKLATDEDGLHFEIDANLRKTSVRDLVEDLDRGDISQASFGFRVLPDGDDWSFSDQGFPKRTLLSVELFDVSPVTFPAYLDTDSAKRMALRSLADSRGIEVDAICGPLGCHRHIYDLIEALKDVDPDQLADDRRTATPGEPADSPDPDPGPDAPTQHRDQLAARLAEYDQLTTAV